MSLELKRRPFTVAEYVQLGTAGVIGEDERVELIEGEIIAMAPIGAAHSGYVGWLNRRLSEQVGNRALLWVQSPLRLSGRSEPQPDLMLLRPRDDFYTSAHPRPADVLLLVEVAESSLAYDRDIKLPLYAAAGIPEVWLIDTAARRATVFSNPSGGAYEVAQEIGPQEQLVPDAFPDVRIQLDEIGA